MPLPTCECVNGLPTQQQLGAIYCALLDILAASGGGEITLSQISDLDASWITPLQTPVTPFGASVLTASPNPDNVLAVDAGGLLTAVGATPEGFSLLQISNTDGIVQLSSSVAGVFDPVGTAEFIAGGPVFSGNVNPITDYTAVNGVTTAAS